MASLDSVLADSPTHVDSIWTGSTWQKGAFNGVSSLRIVPEDFVALRGRLLLQPDYARTSGID